MKCISIFFWYQFWCSPVAHHPGNEMRSVLPLKYSLKARKIHCFFTSAHGASSGVSENNPWWGRGTTPSSSLLFLATPLLVFVPSLVWLAFLGQALLLINSLFFFQVLKSLDCFMFLILCFVWKNCSSPLPSNLSKTCPKGDLPRMSHG